jgi:hypothetical protein
MGKPLTESSDVKCAHEGTVSITGTPKLTVSGHPVLLRRGVVEKSISDCTPPTNNTPPCLTVTTILLESQAQKLTVNGQPVILDTLAGSTDGPPPGTLTATANQSKLKAV